MIYLKKGPNGRYKIDHVSYGGGNFREGVEESGGQKYYLVSGRNTHFGIAEITAVLDGREYVLAVPEGDHYLVYTEVTSTTKVTHSDGDKLAFRSLDGEDITSEIRERVG